MKTTFDLLADAAEQYKDTVLAAERHIWNNPEPGYREWKTHAYMKEQFENLGYSVTEAGNIPGFYTDVDTGIPGPKLAIFAEMDSLIVPSHPECDPETGAVHACGHHAQCAAMLGIAAALKTPGALDSLSGSIRLIVVPAEEGIEIEYRRSLKKQGIIHYYSGKLEFMCRGILDGVDLAMMVHTSSNKGISCTKGSNGCMIKEAYRQKRPRRRRSSYGHQCSVRSQCCHAGFQCPSGDLPGKGYHPVPPHHYKRRQRRQCHSRPGHCVKLPAGRYDEGDSG